MIARKEKPINVSNKNNANFVFDFLKIHRIVIKIIYYYLKITFIATFRIVKPVWSSVFMDILKTKKCFPIMQI